MFSWRVSVFSCCSIVLKYLDIVHILVACVFQVSVS